MASNSKQTSSSSKKATTKADKSAKTTTSTKKSATKVQKTTAPSKQVQITKPRIYKFIGIVVGALLILFLMDLLVQYINNDASVAVVNGKRISTSEFEERLTEVYGESIVTLMINEALIQQEAEEAGITVELEEIDELVNKTIEELGGQEEFENALLANGLTEDTYRRNLEIQLLAEKLIVEEPSDEELLAFFEENKEVYFEEGAVYEDVKEELQDIYRTQKFNELSPAWLSELQENADVTNNISEPPSYGVFMTVRNLLTQWNDRLEESEE